MRGTVDVRTGDAVRRLGRRVPTGAVAFGTVDDEVVLGVDRLVEVRSVRTEEVRWSAKLGALIDYIQTIGVARAGGLVAASSGRQIAIFDAADGAERETWRVEGLGNHIVGLALSDDGDVLALLTADGAIEVRDPTSEHPLMRPDPDVRSTGIALDLAGRRLASAAEGGRASVRDLASQDEPLVLDHPGKVRAVVLSDDGRLLATLCHDRAVRVFDTADGALLQTIVARARGSVLGLSPDGSTVAFTTTRTSITVCSTADARRLHRFTFASCVNQLTVSPEGRHLLVGTFDGAYLAPLDDAAPAPPVHRSSMSLAGGPPVAPAGWDAEPPLTEDAPDPAPAPITMAAAAAHEPSPSLVEGADADADAHGSLLDHPRAGLLLIAGAALAPWGLHLLVRVEDWNIRRDSSGVDDLLGGALEAALWVGLVSLAFGVLALMLAHLPSRRVRAAGRTGRALASLLAAIGVLVGSAALAIPPTFDWAPRVGECIEYDDDDVVWLVRCSEPHHAEIFLVEDHPAPPGAPFAGEALTRWVFDRCDRAFERFVGRPEPADDGLSYDYFEPTRESWADGDREVICGVSSEDEAELLTGSARGAALR